MDSFAASTSSCVNSDTESNIFREFEIENSVKIPVELKNLLIFNGFDNTVTLSTMDLSDISKVEQIARDHIPDSVDNEELYKYLGKFKNTPTKFFILPGQKRLLNELIVFANHKRANKRRRMSNNSETPSVAEKRHREDMVTAMNYYVMPNDIIDDPSSPPEQDAFNYLSATETTNMFKLLENWILNFCTTNLPPEQTARISQTLSRIKLHSPDGLQCSITCCICLKTQKLYRGGQGTSWIMSNFHKHFKTHFVPGKRFSRNFISSYNQPPEESSGCSSMAEDDLIIDEKPIMRPFSDSF